MWGRRWPGVGLGGEGPRENQCATETSLTRCGVQGVCWERGLLVFCIFYSSSLKLILLFFLNVFLCFYLIVKIGLTVENVGNAGEKIVILPPVTATVISWCIFSLGFLYIHS